MGAVPGGTNRNWDSYGHKVKLENNNTESLYKNILADPQTSGGLLISVGRDSLEEVISILNEYVRPAVEADGGNIAFDSYIESTKTVKVILQGACSGCPSSTVTLKNGIEAMLTEMLNGKVTTVEAING